MLDSRFVGIPPFLPLRPPLVAPHAHVCLRGAGHRRGHSASLHEVKGVRLRNGMGGKPDQMALKGPGVRDFRQIVGVGKLA